MKFNKIFRKFLNISVGDVIHSREIITNPILFYDNFTKPKHEAFYKKLNINKYLPMIIENFNDKIIKRKEIIKTIKEVLNSDTKLPTDINNEIVKFVDNLMVE